MDAFFFGAKRAFQATLRITRRWMAKIRMTPARFDMLQAIAAHKGGVWQSELRGFLGVTAQTISRMLRALEELKMVIRERDPIVDGRRLWVSLTSFGKKRLRRAEKVLVDSGALRLAVDCALLDRDRIADRRESVLAIENAKDTFWQIRLGFHDRATLYERRWDAEWDRWRPKERDSAFFAMALRGERSE